MVSDELVVLQLVEVCVIDDLFQHLAFEHNVELFDGLNWLLALFLLGSRLFYHFFELN